VRFEVGENNGKYIIQHITVTAFREYFMENFKTKNISTTRDKKVGRKIFRVNMRLMNLGQRG
jgi:hypothetical protein